ncbi:MAG: hypothetical protein JRC92_02400 [Deltaproteobacteria bacterium]|nr:hypothetical protein [Deltaproteobacteria bacterium]
MFLKEIECPMSCPGVPGGQLFNDYVYEAHLGRKRNEPELVTQDVAKEAEISELNNLRP